MRALLLLLLAFSSLSACLKLETADDSGSVGASSSTAAGSSGASSAVTGTNCGVDPETGVSICLGISSCPTAQVDSDQLPGCGYRISGNVIDLECVCNDSLCPVGSATSCDDARALLADQTSSTVCASVAEGSCVEYAPTNVSGTPNTSSTCDKSCRDRCDDDGACITLCGC